MSVLNAKLFPVSYVLPLLFQFSVLKDLLKENVPEDRVKSQKCGTCLKNWFPSSFAQRYPMMS